MSLAPYGRLLGRPAVLRLVLLSLVARLPHAAVGVVLTLHVVTTLGKGYAQAGLVAAAMTVGMALGGPWRGRLVDRHGVRRAVLPSVVVEAAVWTAAPFLAYEALVGAAVLAGVFMVPVFTVVRQSLAVLVPVEEQRTAFALDSVGTELTFMLGPALAVLLATQVSTTAALVVIGVATVGAGALLMWLDPPVRSVHVLDTASPTGGRTAGVSRTRLVGPGLVVVLVASSAAALVLNGTDVSIIASLREWDQVASAGWMIALWAGGSVLGGLAYGAGHRSVHPLKLVLLLSLLTVPAAFAGTPLLLAIAVVVAGLACAPALSSITATLVRLVPEHRRGEVMGWNGSAMTVGAALGAPVCGALIDAAGPSAGFLAAATAGVVLSVAGLVVLRVTHDRAVAEASRDADQEPAAPGEPTAVVPAPRRTDDASADLDPDAEPVADGGTGIDGVTRDRRVAAV